MDAWLKWLIAAACGVVIVWGAVAAGNAIQQSNRRAEIMQFRADQAECSAGYERAVKTGKPFSGLTRCLWEGWLDVPEVNRILIANGRDPIEG